jgi:hypothetical protein
VEWSGADDCCSAVGDDGYGDQDDAAVVHAVDAADSVAGVGLVV